MNLPVGYVAQMALTIYDTVIYFSCHDMVVLVVLCFSDAFLIMYEHSRVTLLLQM